MGQGHDLGSLRPGLIIPESVQGVGLFGGRRPFHLRHMYGTWTASDPFEVGALFAALFMGAIYWRNFPVRGKLNTQTRQRRAQWLLPLSFSSHPLRHIAPLQ